MFSERHQQFHIGSSYVDHCWAFLTRLMVLWPYMESEIRNTNHCYSKWWCSHVCKGCKVWGFTHNSFTTSSEYEGRGKMRAYLNSLWEVSQKVTEPVIYVLKASYVYKRSVWSSTNDSTISRAEVYSEKPHAAHLAFKMDQCFLKNQDYCVLCSRLRTWCDSGLRQRQDLCEDLRALICTSTLLDTPSDPAAILRFTTLCLFVCWSLCWGSEHYKCPQGRELGRQSFSGWWKWPSKVLFCLQRSRWQII